MLVHPHHRSPQSTFPSVPESLSDIMTTSHEDTTALVSTKTPTKLEETWQTVSSVNAKAQSPPRPRKRIVRFNERVQVYKRPPMSLEARRSAWLSPQELAHLRHQATAMAATTPSRTGESLYRAYKHCARQGWPLRDQNAVLFHWVCTQSHRRGLERACHDGIRKERFLRRFYMIQSVLRMQQTVENEFALRHIAEMHSSGAKAFAQALATADAMAVLMDQNREMQETSELPQELTGNSGV